MIIKEDFSYVEKDMKFIDRGYAQLDVHSIRIDRYFTEKQKEQNVKIHDAMPDQWGKYCEEMAQKIGEKVKSIVDYLSETFNIHQYKDSSMEHYDSDWDLFFWCNHKHYGRDYSYVTLSFNSKRTVTQRMSDKDRVIEILNTHFTDMDGVIVYIQYTATYDDKKVKDTVNNYIPTILNTFINYAGHEGKIKSVGENRYGFFKKGARKYYYQVSDMVILEMAIA
jgi:hypothetical protein